MPRTSKLSPRNLVRRITPGAGLFAKPTPWLPHFRLPKAGHGPGNFSLGRLGHLEVRLARNGAEIRRAQKLRYHVFYQEMSAIPDARTAATGRDTDGFDTLCDHLLVVDHDVATRSLGRTKPAIVGTYRLLRQEIADLNDGFYTAGEYELQGLIDRHPQKRFLELGRSCVLAPYRNKRTVELLWHGIWSYVLHHNIDVMVGCASLDGTDPDRLALPLSFLHHHCSAPPEWHLCAVPERAIDMNRMDRADVDAKSALRDLPPLIKGYLRLGAFVGAGAVVDHQFGTTDVAIVLPVATISSRYINYYGPNASRYAS